MRLLGEGESAQSGEVGFPQRGPSVVAVAREDVPAFMNCTTRSRSEQTDTPPSGVVDLNDVKPGDFGEITLCYSIHDNPGYVQLHSEELADDENTVTEPEASAAGESDAETDTQISGSGELGDEIQAVAWYDPDGDNRYDDDETTLIAQGSLNDVVGTKVLLDPQRAGGVISDSPGPEAACHVPGTNCVETLYLSDTGGSDSDFDDRTKLFEVELKDEGGNPVAELTQLTELPTDNFAQVDAIAATPSGEAVYVVDKATNHLGRYAVSSGNFDDLGVVSGISGAEAVLATFSPDGELYVAGQANDELYTVDTSTATVTSSTTIDGGVDVSGADIVYGADGTLYLYSSADGMLYTVDPSTGNSTLVGSSQTDKGSLTGLGITGAGTGLLVGSSESDNAIVVLDKQDGSAGTSYEMQLSGSDAEYPYGYGDLSVGAFCPEYCIALAWWLPRDVGNEVQSDSYQFDITLRTEQCRNNSTPFESDAA